MNEETEKSPVQYTDPINNKTITVKSIYIPKNLLLKGALYKRGPTVLGVQQTIKEKDNG